MAIFSALGAAVAGSVFGLTAGTFAFGAVVSGFQLVGGLGLSLLAQSLAGKPKGPEKPSFSISGKIQAGGDVPRSFLFGLAMTAGSLVYANTYGEANKTPNAYFTQVIALSDLPVQSLEEVWVNGEKVTLTGTNSGRGYAVEEYHYKGANHLWVRFFDGTQTTAPSFLTDTVSSTERPYGSDRVGRGVAYAVVTARINQELFTGFPSFKFACRGAALYDPSQDTTAGGSGSQRWNNPATWGGDGDHLPAVQLYNLLRGISYDGDWLYGLQSLPAARLPNANWIAQIAKCRASISGPDGSEATYRAGGEIWVNAEVADTAEALLTTCQGRLCEAGGTYSLLVGAPGSAAASITDDDILSTEEQTFTPFFGLAETITGVNARYPSPEEGWTVKVAPPRIDATLEAPAGNRRLMADVPLDYVPYKGQVQRLMKEALAEAQRARRHTIVLPPEFWGIEPGDFLSWTSPRNGYVTKLFRVDGAIDRANLDQVVDLTEVDPDDYDWDQEADYRVPVDGSLGVERPPAQVISGFGVEAATVNNDLGSPVRPAIRLYWDWDDEEDADVEGVEFEVRRAATAVKQFEGRGNVPEAGELIIASFSFTPNTDYEVRARFVTISKARAVTWSLWLPVTTPDIRLGPDDIYLPGMVEEINAFVSEATKWIGSGLRELVDEARLLAEATADQDAGNYADKQQLRTELASVYEQTTAEYTNAVTVATGPGSAIAQRLEQLRTEVFDPVTGLPATNEIVNLLSSRVDTVEGGLLSQANAILALTASYNSVSASANLRMSASAGPSGYAARIGFEARAGGAGSYRAASLYLDVPNSAANPTRVVVVADQFMVSSGSNMENPFVFQSGVARLNVANIGTITSGLIRSGDSNFQIQLNNSRLLIVDNT